MHPMANDIEQLRLLERIGATKNCPAFGVDFGEIDYRAINRFVRSGLVAKQRAYRYGENRKRIGYWITDAGHAALAALATG